MHWGQNKMATVLQIFCYALTRTKIIIFSFNFHWRFTLKVQMTMNHDWSEWQRADRRTANGDNHTNISPLTKCHLVYRPIFITRFRSVKRHANPQGYPYHARFSRLASSEPPGAYLLLLDYQENGFTIPSWLQLGGNNELYNPRMRLLWIGLTEGQYTLKPRTL